MEIKFNKQFSPITALPFSKNRAYREVAPCFALQPYIKCYWGSFDEIIAYDNRLYNDRLVTPDACIDIIIKADNEKIKIKFCGLNQPPYYSSLISDNKCFVFAIRFYFWAIPFFILDNIEIVQSTQHNCDDCFPGISEYLNKSDFLCSNFDKKKVIIETFLLEKLNGTLNVSNNLLNSVDYLLKNRGALSVKELAEYSVVSERTLERQFQFSLGISPKELLGLIRYQYLWRKILSTRNFDIQDEVYAFGFYDQAHLLNNFRKYHGLSLEKAIEYIKIHSDGFLQYNSA